MNKIEKMKRIIKGKNPSYPIVKFKSKELEKRLSSCYVWNKPISKCLDEILSELGLDANAEILIDGYKDLKKEIADYRPGFSIACFKSMKPIFNLRFIYEYNSFHVSHIICSNEPFSSIKREYRISHSNGKLKLAEDSYEETFYKGGRKYYRNFSPEVAKYRMTLGEDELVLTIECSREEAESNRFVTNKNYVPRNEKQLVDYITDLTFPISIEEVYKKIEEISLGPDISQYPFIHLLIKNRENATDRIELENGKCSKFMKTKNGKSISIDENGSWAYKLDTGVLSEDILDDNAQKDTLSSTPLNQPTIKFTMSGMGDRISYEVQADSSSELDNYAKDLASYDIAVAKEEVKEAQGLVRKLIPHKNK